MTEHTTRRRFLSTAAAVPAGLALPVRAADRGSEGEDYRALVCVFLYGGADMVNLVVPRSPTAYATYSATRGSLAEPVETLLPITPATPDGNEYGMHRVVPELQQLFSGGELAVVPNLGPLSAPIDKQQYLARSVPVPRFLFSHNDQQAQWYAADADGVGRSGWCGRLADRLHVRNGSAGGALSMNISLAGSVSMMVGDDVTPFALSPAGTVALAQLDARDNPLRRRAFERLLAARQDHVLGAEAARVRREAILIDHELSTLLRSAPTFDDLFDFRSHLGAQLRMVARMVAIRRALGVRRQVFFVGAGDFDTHLNQAERLPRLFRDLSRVVDAFQRAMRRLGESERVTTFTSSDFGRTLTSNGRGSDHGWGGHALVVGGSVRGGDIHGRMPELTLGGPDDIGEGRLLPQFAVDQYAATLGRWMGLDANALAEVFPNLGRFAASDLGFMNP